jgi:predicted chitinase
MERLRFTTIAQRINGDQNGAADRLSLYSASLKVPALRPSGSDSFLI